MRPTTLCNRAVIRIGGDEARPFLQGLLTQDVLTLAPGNPRWAGLLTPQGKALFDLMLWAAPDDDADVLIDCEAERAEALMKRLMLYRLRRPVTIARENGVAVHWSDEGGAQGVPDPRLPALGNRWLGPTEEGDASAVWQAHRLNLGVPEGVTELGEDKTLWLECNAQELNGVDYAKGCYVGQENTARMHYRSKVNRRLVILPIAQSDPARQRHAWPEIGLALDHRPVETLDAIALPDWLSKALEDAPAS
ncbi:MAG: folate-binding protein YgfZ [Sphingobium sp.]|nr:folate-binding protein YgfZ [Sphingobium sp.]